MAAKKKLTGVKRTLKGKHPIMNFRATPETKARLRAAALRIGVSQGELMRRFVSALPAKNAKLTKRVSVDIKG